MRRYVLALFVLLQLVFAASASAACFQSERSSVAAAGGSGQILVGWQHASATAKGPCGHSVVLAAIGSPAGGFTQIGPIDTGDGEFSAPSGAYVDGAGDVWIVGVRERGALGREGPYTVATGAWLVFRPAGGHFAPAVTLPGDHGATPAIAGSQDGRVLVAWSTEHGSSLAWVTPRGGITRPTRYLHSFRLTHASVDEAGQALIAGYYPVPANFYAASSIALIAGSYGHFSPPQVIVARPRDPRRHLVGVLTEPVLASGPTGQALIAWQSSFVPSYPSIGTDLLVYRQADGQLSKPVRFAAGLSLSPSEPGSLAAPDTAILDGEGRGLILASAGSGGGRGSGRTLYAITVAANGVPSAPQSLARSTGSNPLLAGNAAGETAIVWREDIPGTDLNAAGVSALVGTVSQPGLLPLSIAPPAGEALTAASVVIGPVGPPTAIWSQGAQTPSTIDARGLTPGAQTVMVGTL